MAGSRPPFPSAPSDPNLRRLGVGSGVGRERPVRAQLVVALVVAVMLTAVPLYLWRRPSLSPPTAPSASASAALSAQAPVASSLPPPSDAGSLEPAPVSLGGLRKVRCGQSSRVSTEEACDELPTFEKNLLDAVRGTVDCAPKTKKGGSINYVLEVDFGKKSLHVFPGKSGELRGPLARRAAKCVLAALPKPDWETIPHRHRYYAMAVLATYPGRAE